MSTQNALDLSSVVQAWDRAHQDDIHPLGKQGDNWAYNPDETYWKSGEHQAAQVSDYAKKGATVVDFGCGNGRLSIPLVRAGYSVVAADASANMLTALKERATEAGVTVKTVQSDGTDLADRLGKKKRADVIVVRAVLIHHDYAGVEEIVTGLAKALKPGGYLIADWPLADKPEQRSTWISVTTWDAAHRLAVAERAGLEPVHVGDDPTVWRKI